MMILSILTLLIGFSSFAAEGPFALEQAQVMSELQEQIDDGVKPMDAMLLRPIKYSQLDRNLSEFADTIERQSMLSRLNITVDSNLTSREHAEWHNSLWSNSFFTLQSDIHLYAEMEPEAKEKTGFDHLKGRLTIKSEPSAWWAGLLSKDAAHLLVNAPFDPLDIVKRMTRQSRSHMVCRNPRLIRLHRVVLRMNRDDKKIMVEMTREYCKLTALIESAHDYAHFLTMAQAPLMNIIHLADQLLIPEEEELEGSFGAIVRLVKNYDLKFENCRGRRDCKAALTMIAKKEIGVAGYKAQAQMTADGLEIAADGSALNVVLENFVEGFNRDQVYMQIYSAMKGFERMSSHQLSLQATYASAAIDYYIAYMFTIFGPETFVEEQTEENTQEGELHLP